MLGSRFDVGGFEREGDLTAVEGVLSLRKCFVGVIERLKSIYKMHVLSVLLAVLVVSYDYFQLALQWRPGVCETKWCVQSFRDAEFSIHGLWPSNDNEKDPEYCINLNNFEVAPSSRIELEKHWSSNNGENEHFWKYE